MRAGAGTSADFRMNSMAAVLESFVEGRSGWLVRHARRKEQQ